MARVMGGFFGRSGIDVDLDISVQSDLQREVDELLVAEPAYTPEELTRILATLLRMDPQSTELGEIVARLGSGERVEVTLEDGVAWIDMLGAGGTTP